MKTKYFAIFLLIVLIFSFVYYNYYIKQSDLVFSLNNLSVTLDDKDNLKVMTYNIHHGVGLDGKLNINRTAEVIKSSQASIIGLNEVDSRMLRSNFQNQLKIISKKVDMNYVFSPTLNRFVGSYGNALLTKFPVKKISNHKLPVEVGREPRGLLEAEVLISPSVKLNVFVTHLSLIKQDRIRQWEWLLKYIDSKGGPFILMGDFNFQKKFANNTNYFLATDKTYPSENPEKEIDMFFSDRLIKKKVYTIKSSASDHLPLVMELKYNFSESI